MKRNSASVLCVFFLLSGCENSEIVAPGGYPPPSEIHGQILSWGFGDSMTISATPLVQASGAVRRDGTFFLSLPTPSPSELQRTISPYDTLSDTAAGTLILNGLVIANPDQSLRYWVINKWRASLQTSTPGDFSLIYVYSDRPVFWRRTQIIPGADTLGAVFDMHLNKGWNLVTAREETDRPHYMVQTFRVENIAVLTWYIVGIIDS